jgi:predicted metal-dependent phosphoesterase TrpH
MVTPPLPLLKIDMHVHTEGSPDAHTRIKDLPAIIRAKGLDGVAVTEHDRFDPPRFSEVIILPGVEISSADGHIIALGVRELVPHELTADETIERIHSQGGVVIIPHPYDPVCECVKIANLKIKPDAVETMNADALSFRLSNYLARKDARRFDLPEVGGSDSHIPQSIGDCYTLIESPTRATDDILSAIRSGKTRPAGSATSLTNKMRKLSYKFR